MNLNGTFTAPTAGIYMFINSGMGIGEPFTLVYLQVNGHNLLSSYASEQYSTYAQQAVLTLNVGDKVSLYLDDGAVGHCNYYNTHYTGIQLA